MCANETTEGSGAAQLRESSSAAEAACTSQHALQNRARNARSKPLQRVAKFTRRAQFFASFCDFRMFSLIFAIFVVIFRVFSRFFARARARSRIATNTGAQ